MSEQRLMHHRWRADAAFAALSLGARDLFYGLMGICDSWGCLKVNPIPIRNEVYLGAESLPELSRVADWLAELREASLLACWEDGDKTYAEVKWFMDEQRIRYRRRRETPVPPWRDDDGLATGKTPATQRNLENASDAVQQAKRQRRSPAEERRREERRGEANNQEHEACQEVPSAPPRGGPEGNSGGTKPEPGLLADPIVLGKTLLLNETHYVQKAWALILEEVQNWGPCFPSTILALAQRAEVAPERALAFVLDIRGDVKIESNWGALNHALKKTRWDPTDENQKWAKELIRAPPAPRNGVGTIGETIKEMGGKT